MTWPRLKWTSSALALCALALALTLGACSSGDPEVQIQSVSFETSDGGRIFGDLYRGGDRAVILAHGKVFSKESWEEQATTLKKKGYTALAINFRGYGESTSGSKEGALYEDVLGALSFLQAEGYRSISIVGGSMGGAASAMAATRAPEGAIDRLILLSPAPIENPEALEANAILYIVSAEEPIRPRVQDQFDRAPSPKQIEILPGSAHAQHIFKADQAQALTDLILDFLAGDL